MTEPQLIAFWPGKVKFPNKENGETDTLVRVEVDAVSMGTVKPVEHHVGHHVLAVNGDLETVDDKFVPYLWNNLPDVINRNGIDNGKRNLTDETHILGWKQCIRIALLQLLNIILICKSQIVDVPLPDLIKKSFLTLLYGIATPTVFIHGQVGWRFVECE